MSSFKNWVVIALFAWLGPSLCGAQPVATTSLPESYYGHSLAASSNFLYHAGGLGGINGVGSANKVFYAPIQASGALGAWTEAAPLPRAVFFHSGLASSNALYVLGGYNYDTELAVSNKVYFSRLNPSGVPGAWQETTPLPEAVFFLSAAIHNGAVYVTGGWNGSALTSAVYSARIQSDGSLGPWTAQLPLPEGVYTHAAVSNGTLYVLGGAVNGGTQIQNTVYYSSINPDGTLSGWRTTTPLPLPLSNHAAIVANGHLITAGGWVGASPTDSIFDAAINGDSSLGNWATLPALPHALYLLAGAASANHFYMSGGTDGLAPQSAVYYMPLPAPPPPPPPTDILPPRTSLMVGAPRYGNAPVFLTGASLLSLSAIDDALVVGDGKGAVDFTQYSVDSAAFGAYSGPISITTEGPHELRFFSVDKAGNRETTQSSSLAVDGTAPVSSLAVGMPQVVSSSGDLIVGSATPLSISAEDPIVNGVASGLSSILAAVDAAPLAPALSSFTVAGDGLHTVTSQVMDKVQNKSTRIISLFVDATAPISSIAVGAPRAILGSGDLIVSPLTPLSVSAEDPVVNGVAVGVASVLWGVDNHPLASPPDNFTLSGDGAHEVRTQGSDRLGNTEILRRSVVYVDGIPPVTSLELSSPAFIPPAAAVLNAATVLKFIAHDPLNSRDPLMPGVASGVNHTEHSVDGNVEPQSDEFALQEGFHTVSYFSVDNVGNTETPHSASYRVDATPPVSTLEIGAPALSLFGVEVMTPDTPLTLTAADPLSNGVTSGVSHIFYSVDGGPEQVYNEPFKLKSGPHSLSFRAVDFAGNAEEPNGVNFSINSLLGDAAAGLNLVTLSGQATVIGDVRSNGPFSAGGKSRVQGNVTALRVTLNGKSEITGAVSEGKATLDPNAFDLAAAKAHARGKNNNSAIPSNFLSNGALKLAAHDQLSLPAGDYFLTGLEVSGQGKLSISGEAHLFISGPVSISGQGTVNESGDAADLWMVSDAGSVGLAGAARAAFNLYAPLAEVSISGLGEFAGHVLGAAVTLSGKALQPSTKELPQRRRIGRIKHLDIANRIIHVPGTANRGHLGDLDLAVVSNRIDHESIKGTINHSANTSSNVAAKPPVSQQPAPGEPKSTVAAGPPSAAREVKKSAPAVKPVFDISPKVALSFVGSEGLEVRSKSQSAVVIPQGAVSSGLGVTVCPPKAPDENEAARRIVSTLRQGIAPAGEGVQFGPEGTHFAKPVTIEIPYNRLNLASNISEDSLAVRYWNPKSSEWELLASEVDKKSQIVRAKTDHFSLYQVFSGASPQTASPSAGFYFGQVFAFPNPARPGQNPTIHVEAGSADSVEIRIYDLSGELRAGTSLSGPQNPFEYAWNASGAGSGVYIYVVTAFKNGVGSMRKTGRLAVIK